MGIKQASHNKTKRTRLIPVYPVRCLGAGPEHMFMSTDPRKHRVCERCKKRIKDSEVSYSPRLYHPVKTIAARKRRGPI